MADPGIREYRKGNWTVSETMVLIEAKKMDEERRMRRSIGLTHADQTDNRNKPTELRWKWIEDYCCGKGCFRNQNQCNDKWDNLMRDYKKVREYERRRAETSLQTEGTSSSSTSAATASYWKMEREERKERNLPSNMLPQIYDALDDVVEKKTAGQSQRTDTHHNHHQQITLGFVHHQPVSLSVPTTSALLPVLPPPQPLPASQTTAQTSPRPPALFSHPLIVPTTCNSSDSDASERSDSSPAKRRRRSRGQTAAGTSRGTASDHDVGATISRSAFVIADAIRASEEGQEKRHRDLVGLQERRLKIEESKVEINRQGVNGLVDAINKLANSILALASSSGNDQNHQESGPQ